MKFYLIDHAFISTKTIDSNMTQNKVNKYTKQYFF